MEKRIQTQTGDGIAPYEDEIELMDYILVVWKRKWIIIIVPMLFFLVAFTITYLNNLHKTNTKYITEAIIQLNFQGIEQYTNPDGTQFEKEQLITPSILSKAYVSSQKSDNNSRPTGLRRMIDIHPLTPPEILEKVKKDKTYTFFPNQFSITLTTTSDDTFSEKERIQIISSIISNYKKEFLLKYGEEPLLLTHFPKDFIATNDYFTIAKSLRIKISDNIKILDSKIKSVGFFRSKETGISFSDEQFEASIILENIIELEKIISTFTLTKNPDKLIEILTSNLFEIEMLEEKKKAHALLARELLREIKTPKEYKIAKQTDVQRETTTPAVSLSQSFIEDLINKNAYSFLIKKVIDSGTRASDLEIEKKFLEKRISLLRKDNKHRLATSWTKQLIEDELKSFLTRITNLSKDANALNKEYLKSTLPNVIQITSEPVFSKVVKGGQSIKRNVVLATCVGLFFAIFLAFFIEYLSKYKSQEKELVTTKIEPFDDGVKK